MMQTIARIAGARRCSLERRLPGDEADASGTLLAGLDVRFETHPRMDAAHELHGSRFVHGLAVRAPRRDEVVGIEVRALGRDLGLVRELIEEVHDAAAEIRDLRERVDFAALVL